MTITPRENTPDYIIIGHITRDILKDGSRLGGSAVYCSLVANRMGLNVGLFTCCEEGLDLEPLAGIEIINQESAFSTTFNNQYSVSGRKQLLIERAPDLDLALIPESWKKARIVHLAPVAGEVNLNAGSRFKSSEIFYSLQGWLRNWDEDGVVKPALFPKTQEIPGHTAAGFLSIEDLGYDRSQMDHLTGLFPELVLTFGEEGAELHQGRKITLIPPYPTREVDPTGSGDIFATAFIIDKVIGGRSSVDSAKFAASLAALSTTRSGLAGVPSVEEIKGLREVL